METIKKLRKNLDGIAQVVARLKPVKTFEMTVDSKDFHGDKLVYEAAAVSTHTASKFTLKCCEEIELAKAWCGKLLGYLGTPTPYQNDGSRKEVAHIEPVDDRVDVEAWEEKNNWKNFNHIERVDTLRGIIEKFTNQIQMFAFEEGVKVSREANIARTQIEIHLIEARFQLGFELGRIREEAGRPLIDIDTPLYGAVIQR